MNIEASHVSSHWRVNKFRLRLETQSCCSICGQPTFPQRPVHAECAEKKRELSAGSSTQGTETPIESAVVAALSSSPQEK